MKTINDVKFFLTGGPATSVLTMGYTVVLSCFVVGLGAWLHARYGLDLSPGQLLPQSMTLQQIIDIGGWTWLYFLPVLMVLGWATLTRMLGGTPSNWILRFLERQDQMENPTNIGMMGTLSAFLFLFTGTVEGDTGEVVKSMVLGFGSTLLGIATVFAIRNCLPKPAPQASASTGEKIHGPDSVSDEEPEFSPL